MIKSNCNLIAPKALPISTDSLIDFNKLYILRRKVLESIFIAPSHGNKVYRPERNVFRQPVQVVVLGIDGDEVKLGVYAHPHLTFKQGPEPDAHWQQQWKDNRGHSSRKLASGKSLQPPVPFETDLALAEGNAADELDALAEARYFLYQAIEALFDSEGTRQSSDWPLVKSGFGQWKEWLLLREDELQHRLKEEACATPAILASRKANLSES